MPGYIYVKDLDSRYLFGNKNFRQLLGVESLDGKMTSDFMSNELTETIKEHDRYVLKTNSAKTFEEIFYWKNHGRSVFLTSRFPYRDSNNEIIGICVVAHDITEFENISDQSGSGSKFQLSKLAVAGKLAFEVSQTVIDPLEHVRNLNQEILSDLNSDGCDLELLKQKFIQTDQMIQKVHRAAEAIHWLESLDSGPKIESATLAEVLAIVSSLFEEKIRRFKVVWDISGIKCPERELFVDKINLTEVITNMTILSLEAIEGCAEKRISFSSEVNLENLALTLEHSCVGKIPVGITTFEGLSWSICESIVQKQGWKIEYKNIQDKEQIQLVLPMKTSISNTFS
jgi:PAS domain S-box-containing protein